MHNAYAAVYLDDGPVDGAMRVGFLPGKNGFVGGPTVEFFSLPICSAD